MTTDNFLTVTELDTHGCGVGWYRGEKILIEDSVPGDVVRFSFLRRGKQYSRARIEELFEAGPLRVTPICPHAGVCNGCQLQHLHRHQQQQLKQAELKKLCQQYHLVPQQWLTTVSGQGWGYRQRARLHVLFLQNEQRMVLGFHQRASTYIIDLNHCPVLHPELSRLLAPLHEVLLQLSCRHRVPKVELVSGDNAVQVVIRHLLEFTAEDLHLLSQFAQQQQVQVLHQPGGPDELLPVWPQTLQPLSYAVQDTTLLFMATDFVQNNLQLNQRLVKVVQQLLACEAQDRVLDLYCGIGNFTLLLARQAGEIIGLEGNARLVDKARHNAALNKLGNVDFQRVDLLHPEHIDFSCDRLLIDPPREGAINVVKQLPTDIRRIVYVSCNSSTLLRDCSYLVNVKGYQLKQLGLVDMFPHTRHVEAVAVLQPGEAH